MKSLIQQRHANLTVYKVQSQITYLTNTDVMHMSLNHCWLNLEKFYSTKFL